MIRHVHPQGFVPREADVMAEAMERVGLEPGHDSDEPLCIAAREIARQAGYDPLVSARLACTWSPIADQP